MNCRTIEEYKKDVFDELDDNKKLEYMYQMSKQLCDISEFIDIQLEMLKGGGNELIIALFNTLKYKLGDSDE